MTTTKYACDIVAPTNIIDKHTDRSVVIDTIEVIPDSSTLLFFGYFEDDGTPWERMLDWDSQVKVKD